jgi:hypothetical protein
MSNYYRNSIDIAQPYLNVTPLVKYIITSKMIGDVSGNTVNSSFTSSTSTTYTTGIFSTTSSSDFTNIDESPNTLYYTYQGTDVSEWCIASYVDSSTGLGTIPSWCTNVRIILIGGGGDAQRQQNPNNNVNQDNAHYISNQHDGLQNQSGKPNQHQAQTQPGNENNMENHQHGTSQHGNHDGINHFHDTQNQQVNQIHHNNNKANTDNFQQAGNGGAGIYLTTISTQTYSQIEITAGQSNQSTILQLSSNSSNSTAYIITAGGAQQASVGTITGQNIQTQGNNISINNQLIGYGYSGASGQGSAVGVNGIANSQTYSTTLTWGDGGSSASTPGVAGYYRVYFLTS